MNKKRKVYGLRAQASHGGTWDRGGYWNLDNQNSTRFGGGRGRRGGGRDRHIGRGGGGRGCNGSNTNPPTKTDRKLEAAVRTDAKEVGCCRRDDGLMGMGTYVRPAVRHSQEKVGSAIQRT